MPSFHFTKRSVEALGKPPRGQVLYRDTTLKGFEVRVGSASKVFFTEGQVNNRTRRVTIGRTNVNSVDEARKRALGILCGMAAGRDPNSEKRKAALEAIKTSQAFDQFFGTRRSMAEGTKDRYGRSINLYLKDWKRKPITTGPMMWPTRSTNL